MIKNSFLMSIVSVTVMLIGIVSQYFLAHYLTKNDYGEFQLILSWITVLSFFSLNSFNTVVLKSSAQSYPVFFRKASLLCFLFSLIGSVILFIIGYFYESEKMQLFLIAAVFFPFYSGINLSQRYFTGKKKYKNYAFLTAGTQITVTALQVAALVLTSSLKTTLYLTLLSTSLINLIVTLYIAKKLKDEKKDLNKEKDLIKYGIYLNLINIIPTVAQKIQFIILNAFTTPAILAIYAAAQLFPSKIKSLFKSLIIPFLVYLAEKDKYKNIKIVKNAILILLLYGIISTIIILIFLPLLINVIFGNSYNESIPYSMLLLVELLFMPVNSTIGSIIIYQGYKKIYAKITTSRSVLIILLYLIFIPFWGIYGIIIPVILISFATFLMNLIWLYKLPKATMQKSLLILSNKKIIDENIEILRIPNKIEGKNIIKIIEADYFSRKEKYPIWVKIIGKLSFTKYL